MIHRDRELNVMKMEASNGVIYLQAKEHLGCLTARERQGADPPLEPLPGTSPAILHLRLLAS
jgi:hypothetical protein